jgi:transmembrane sensor
MPNEHDHRGQPMPDGQRVSYLVAGFIGHTLTEEERGELDAWILASDDNMRLFEELTDERTMSDNLNFLEERDTEGQLGKLKTAMRSRRRARLTTAVKYGIAASLFIAITVLALMFVNKKEKPSITEIIAYDLAPASPLAALTVLNARDSGSRVLQQEGVVDSGIHVANNELVYEKGARNELHKVEVPRKSFYKLVLADGSKVWLNAQSSIVFDANLQTKQARKITLNGEGFFEVAKDKKRPFIVVAGGVEVKAIGTRFNVKAYNNDSHVTVTLTEGAVTVNNQRLSVNQQAAVMDGKITVKAVVPETATGWKDQNFVLKDATIEQIMREVERWYGANIIYEHKPPYHFNATIRRDVPVSKLLHILQQTNQVHFEIRNDTIIVKK